MASGEYAGLVAALASWGRQSAENLTQLQTQLAARIADLGSQGGGQMTAFSVPGQSAAFQYQLSLADLISVYTQAIMRAQGGASIVRRTNARFF
jgi:hypothetical protein